jgi:hypothetical protein
MFELLTSRITTTAANHGLVDPEFLEELASRADGPPSQLAATRDLFSAALSEMRIGGAWKKTHSGRLRGTEAVLCEYFSGKPKRGLLSMLDLGASDGITTLEVHNALRDRLACEIRVYLADKNLWLHRFRSGPLVEYRASDGEPILVRIRGVGLRLAKQRQTGDAGDPLARLYLRLTGLRARLRPGGRILLTNPWVRRETSITPLEMNCLECDPRMVNSVDIVRASNLLQAAYFTPDQIRVALANLHAYLREHGCLVVSRNTSEKEDAHEQGSLWIKHHDRFERWRDFGGGSEISELVDEWAPEDRESPHASAM